MTDDQEIRQFDQLVQELRRQFVDGRKGAELVLLQLESMTDVSRQAVPEPKEDVLYPRARSRRNWFEFWYRKLGFNISIPTPHVPDDEFEKRAKLHQALFYRPPTTAVSYEAFMESLGHQGDDWDRHG